MKKIYLISLCGYTNYGNFWQKYAVKEMYRNFGYKTVSIRAERSIIKFILRPVDDFFHIIKNKRYRMFYFFSLQHGLNKRFWIKMAKFHKNDLFSTGSDQVWNPFMDPDNRGIYFLRFVKKEQRLCISPSFGVTKIDDEFVNEITDGLNGFEYLSSREKDGVEIIRTLTGRNAELLIDPTMMLNKNEWSKLFNNIKSNSKNYIILAMLGKLSNDKKTFLHNVAQNNNLFIIDIYERNNVFTPGEVLSLISNAKLVFTDSFHFSAFSINFNTPFIVAKREDSEVNSNMYSRITSLLSMFGMESRTYETISANQVFNCDFDYANDVLQMERKKFDRYMKKCLKITEDSL
jgi:Polysaccharide pyruvyl transferase.